MLERRSVRGEIMAANGSRRVDVCLDMQGVDAGTEGTGVISRLVWRGGGLGRLWRGSGDGGRGLGRWGWCYCVRLELDLAGREGRSRAGGSSTGGLPGG